MAKKRVKKTKHMKARRTPFRKAKKPAKRGRKPKHAMPKTAKIDIIERRGQKDFKEKITTEIEVPKGKLPKPLKIGSGKIKFKIENIVASANLAVELDLYAIAREVENVEYEPEQFPGAILKLKDPKTSLLLFKNGKLICTGAKSAGDVDKSIHTAYALIKHCIRKSTT
jgi:TATA-box binding protein (TBP) (component of TFIID and TFIIIB)